MKDVRDLVWNVDRIVLRQIDRKVDECVSDMVDFSFDWDKMIFIYGIIDKVVHNADETL